MRASQNRSQQSCMGRRHEGTLSLPRLFISKCFVNMTSANYKVCSNLYQCYISSDFMSTGTLDRSCKWKNGCMEELLVGTVREVIPVRVFSGSTENVTKLLLVCVSDTCNIHTIRMRQIMQQRFNNTQIHL